MFNYCPSCASKNIDFHEGKVYRCPDCGFTFYQNIAAATGCLITVPEPPVNDDSSSHIERLVFLVRGKEPAAGMLDLPGGFVDTGEGVLDGLHRELREEIGWTPAVPDGMSLIDIYKLFASFSNIYEYKGIKYNTCDMYFHVRAPRLKRGDLRQEESEVKDILFLQPGEINFSCFAFPSTVNAVKKYLELTIKKTI